MKNFILTLSICFFSVLSYSQLYIGGVIDGPLTGGTPKAIQICANAAVADMSLYGFGSANNAGGSDGQEFTFPAATLAAGSCFWVASEAPNFTAWFGFAPCYTSSAANINGDDSMELFCGGALIDVFGEVGVDGTGTCWEYLDGWATANDNVPSTTFGCPDATYTYSGPNALDGETTNATAATPYPSPAQTCPAPIVPVTLISFNAKRSDQTVNLNWSTATEINNDYFDVEWSTDGRNFNSLGRVEGSGNSFVEREYSYSHLLDHDGDNYYRLKQVDHDGTTDYSYTVSIKSERTIRKISLRPNLVSNQMTIEGTQLNNYEILSLNGQVIQMANGQGNNTLDLSDLSHGFYFIKLDLGQGRYETLRFIKQ